MSENPDAFSLSEREIRIREEIERTLLENEEHNNFLQSDGLSLPTDPNDSAVIYAATQAVEQKMAQELAQNTAELTDAEMRAEPENNQVASFDDLWNKITDSFGVDALIGEEDTLAGLKDKLHVMYETEPDGAQATADFADGYSEIMASAKENPGNYRANIKNLVDFESDMKEKYGTTFSDNVGEVNADPAAIEEHIQKMENQEQEINEALESMFGEDLGPATAIALAQPDIIKTIPLTEAMAEAPREKYTLSNGDTAAVQEFMLNNREALNEALSLKLKATDIGNEHGKPDDFMGGNTATMLKAIEIASHNTEGGLAVFLSGAGIHSDEIIDFEKNIKVMLAGGRLESAYNNALANVNVDAIEIKVATAMYASAADNDIAPIDLNLAGSPQDNKTGTTQISQKIAAGDSNIVKTVFTQIVSPANSNNIVSITPDDYEALKDRIENNLASNQDKLVATTYSDALLQKQNELGYGSAKAGLTDAIAASINKHARSAELGNEIKGLEGKLEGFQVKDDNGNSISINDVPMILTFDDGSTKTMTYNDFDDAVNDWFDFAGLEGDDEVRIRDAMDIAYAELKETSGYNNLDGEINALSDELRSLFTDTKNQQIIAQDKVAGIEGTLENTTLNIVIPEGVTKSQLANIIPSYEEPKADADNGIIVKDDAASPTNLNTIST